MKVHPFVLGIFCVACSWGSQPGDSDAHVSAQVSRALNQPCAKANDCETGLTCAQFRCVDPIEYERRKCAQSNACAQSGLCTYSDGRCLAQNMTDCQSSRDCAAKGNCALIGTECAPARQEECERSQLCVRNQHCYLRGGRCVWRPEPGEFVPVADRMGVTVYVSKTEVTQGQFASFTGARPSYHKSCGDLCPVERVSLTAAFEYADELSKRAGLSPCYRDNDLSLNRCMGFRLPTESEWQWLSFDAPHGAISFVPWSKENSGFESKPVCSGGVQRFGLCDLLGNVWEWVHPDGALDDSVPKLSAKSVVRGGSFAFRRSSLALPSRWSEDTKGGGMTVGFRLLTKTELR